MSTVITRTVVALAIVVSSAALCVPAGGVPAGSSPASRLADAASGSWTSEFGTVEFRDDGTARFEVTQCGYELVRPGFVEALADCEASVVDGVLRLESGGYAVTDADGTVRYAAYVDGRGRLHVGAGSVVARLGKGRVGRVELAPGEVLVVAGSRCNYYLPDAEPVTVTCAYARDAGRRLLVYEVPGAGAARTDALVYLRRPRLLVSPELVERVFTRS